MVKKRIGWLTLICLMIAILLGSGTPPAFSLGMDPGIIIEKPQAGDTLIAGSKYEIMWDIATDSYVELDLLYSTDGGNSWQEIIKGDYDTFGPDDSYTWTVPNITAPAVIIRLGVIAKGQSQYIPIPEVYYNDSGQFAIKKSLIIPKPDLPDVNPLIKIPFAPANLTGTALSTSSVKLDWEDKSFNENEFIIERKASGQASFAQIATVAANAASYTDGNLQADTQYLYQVKARNSFGSSAYAGPVTVQTKPAIVLPMAPTGLKADTVTSVNVVLSWQDNSDNETGFKIEKATGSGSFTELAAVGSGVASYNDTSVIQGNKYSYQVRAYNGQGNSAYSNAINVDIPTSTTPPSNPPSTPSTTMRFVIGESKYLWNGMTQPMDVAPIVRENRTLLPIRYVADPLGAQVLWNPIERKVSVKTANRTIELWIDNNTATINGTKLMIDPQNPKVMPIAIPPGRTMLPLRFIADNLNCNVEWKADTNEVIVTYPR